MDYIEHLYNLRKNVVKKGNELQILLANFSGTEQQKDIEARTPLINDFFRVKINIKAFDDKERAKKNLEPLDFHNNEAVFGAMRDEFDMPYWAFSKLKNVPLKELKNTFIYQLKACNLYCPWCYVDDTNKNGKDGNNSRFFSITEIIDFFEEERKKQKIYNFRPSGGEPTIAIEQWLNVLQELEKRKLNREVYVQGDTNLSTGHFIDFLEQKGELENNLLEQIASYNNFGVLCSFKGNSTVSFWEATGANPELHQEQFYSLKKLVKAGIDCYPFVYSPEPSSLERFMEKGARIFGEGFYLKTWILPLKLYGPEKARFEAKGTNPELYQQRLDKNFRESEEIMQDLIWKKYGMNYKANPRTGIKLEVKEQAGKNGG
ncbi:radical SAM protein [Candidatus Pacearchaeota archaeon]|nr:radical SAM protein [Candidatus Pacearchaeota archaeon]